MAEITAAMVGALREATGAGMMDCKKALTEAEGVFDKAVDILQIKKKASVAKKASRIAAEGLVHAYVHMGGKIGVLCEVNCETDFVARTEKFQTFVNDVCLHIAAMNPTVVSKDEFPADQVEHQKTIFVAQVIEEGKPAALAEKIVAGKLNKWIQESTLLDQTFVKHPDKTVGDYLAETTGDIGEKISIRRFTRFVLGEGIEKRSDNFAEEVAKQMR